MNVDIDGTLLTWEQQERMLSGLAMDHIDRGRVSSTLATGRAILADLGAVIAEVRQHPHASRADDERIIAEAQAKARTKLAPLTATLSKLRMEAEASADLPVSATKAVDPLTFITESS